jgi:hypothetical protein
MRVLTEYADFLRAADARRLEMFAYQRAHGTKATADRFNVSRARVRQQVRKVKKANGHAGAK